MPISRLRRGRCPLFRRSAACAELAPNERREGQLPTKQEDAWAGDTNASALAAIEREQASCGRSRERTRQREAWRRGVA